MWECRSRSGTTSTMRERRKSDANTTSDTIWRKRTRMGRGPHLPVVTPPLLRPHVGELTKKQHVRFLVPCASRWARTDAPDRASGSGTGRGRRDISGAVRTGVGVVSGLLPQGTRQPKHQHRASGSGAGCGRRGVFGRRAGTGGGDGGGSKGGSKGHASTETPAPGKRIRCWLRTTRLLLAPCVFVGEGGRSIRSHCRKGACRPRRRH